jgi:threonine dehydratase
MESIRTFGCMESNRNKQTTRRGRFGVGFVRRLRVNAPGVLTFPLVQEHVRDIITVSEAEIRAGTRYIYERLKQVIEPSAGTGPGALLAGKVPAGVRRLGVVLCGGNIEPQTLGSLWNDVP